MQVKLHPIINLEIPDEWETLPAATLAELRARFQFAVGNLLAECVTEDAFFYPDHEQEITVSCYLEKDIAFEDFRHDVHVPADRWSAYCKDSYLVHGYWSNDGCGGFPVNRDRFGDLGWDA